MATEADDSSKTELNARRASVPATGRDSGRSSSRGTDIGTANLPKSAGIIPLVRASPLSRLYYFWLDGLLRTGAKRFLEKEDLYELHEPLTSKYLSEKFNKNWEKEKAKPRPLLRALWATFGRKFAFAAAIKIVSDLCQTLSPLLIQYIIVFVQNSQNPDPEAFHPPAWHGYGLIVGMLLSQILGTITVNHYFQEAMTVGFYVRTALITGIYSKSLVLSSVARTQSSTGKIVNHMSTDTYRLDLASGYINMLWSGPLQILVCVILLLNILGVSALAGLGILLIMGPMQGRIMQKLASLRKRVTSFTDKRVKLTQEMLQSVRVIKYYAWETSFLSQLFQLRDKELSFVRKLLVLQAALEGVMEVVPISACITTFVVYSVATPNKLNPSIVFSSLALFNIVRIPMLLLPRAAGMATDAWVSLERIQEFLLAAELDAFPGVDETLDAAILVDSIDFVWEALPAAEVEKGSGSAKANENKTPDSKAGTVRRMLTTEKKTKGKGNPVDIEMREPKADSSSNVIEDLGRERAEDSKNDSTVDDSVEVSSTVGTPYMLSNVKLRVARGSLVAVVGSVGSGKSSLLQALVGEMSNATIGTEDAKNVLFSGTVGYCPQSAWIQNCSLRDNILFGKPLDQEKYERVIDVCQLRRDLEILPDGDLTEIGERGINISGGQKQRINIARAVYYDSDIILLDDPLSAVDAHVCRALFDECINGVLAEKTRVLVTHKLHYLPRVDHVVFMENGRIAEQGPFTELMASNGKFSKMMRDYGGVNEENDDVGCSSAFAPTAGNPAAAVPEEAAKTDAARVPDKPAGLMTSEERSTGSVALSVYIEYFKACASIAVFPIVLLVLAIHQGTKVATDLWLSYWSARSNLPEDSPDYEPLTYWISVYVGLGLSQAVVALVVGVCFALSGARAARVLHDKAIRRVFRAPMQFFDTTPLGRIVNRFSKDVDAIDNLISNSFRMLGVTLASTIATFSLISAIFTTFLVPLAPLMIMYYFFQLFYRLTSRELKRLDSVTRSPLYAHFSETLSGLATIRAYRVQNHFVDMNERHMDLNNRAYYLLIIIQRWLSIRLETIAAFLIFFAGFFGVVARESASASVIGLVLAYALQSTGVITWCVRQMAEVEQNMNAVERVEYYAHSLEVEMATSIPDNAPPANWPDKGGIEIRNLELRYRPGLPPVLRDVSLSIEGGQNVGFVGRTGAGKSTIMMALFRLVEPSKGCIMIDGLDIHKMGLDDLRSRLAIIPQDPVIFQGTIRMNLDPFSKYTDQDLWDALANADMKTYVTGMSGGLDAPVHEGGENLSLGQRQLLCLARASLVKTKILIMDEATASVDLQTDAFLQKAIRRNFADTTILTIAHRINTVIDYDRIVVLDAGRIVEFDTPKNLLAKPEGKFRGMVDATGPTTAALLESLAK